MGYWKLDEGQGIVSYDSSGNKNHGDLHIESGGTQTATSTAWSNGATGKRNGSISLDGTDDWVQITDTVNLRFDANNLDFSVFAWTKRSASGATHYIISKEDADNDGWRLQFDSADTITCSVNAIDITSTSKITDSNWHYIGCIIDRDGNGQLYIDGQSDGPPTAISSATMATTADIRIGSRAYTPTSYFSGQIDEVKLWNYALTPAQILQEYNSGAVRFSPNAGPP